VEDDFVLTGDAHGLYDFNDVEAAYDEFEEYMDKAREAKILPTWWDDKAEDEMWKVARESLCFSVEESDIESDPRYGLIGSIKLRAIAERIWDLYRGCK
jgi:hypothetical protein